MPKIERHTPGTFCWIELATTDTEGSKTFYEKLLGVKSNDTPIPGGVYTMLTVGDQLTGALCAMQEEQRKQGVPPHWSSYILVENADAAAKKAAELGANVIVPVFDVMEFGRMAVIVDPTGATFAIWQAKQHTGMQVRDEPGSLAWNELQTRDVEGAKKFYGALFGWTFETNKFGDTTYTSVSLKGARVGGIFELPKGMDQVPPNWLVYFGTANCDASTEKASSLKAKVVVPPMDIPDTGRFSVLFDPAGAMFALYQQAGK
jgi:predicted enzyme related to lactoylglutathione lyase